MSVNSKIPSTFLQHLQRRKWRVLFALVALVGLVWGARAMGVRQLMDYLVAELRDAGAPIFFGAMAILPALGFPLLPFSLAAGPAFGPVLGTGGVIGCAVLAVCANVALSYALASTLLRALVQRLIVRLGYRLPESNRANAWLLVALVRVAPGVPFWVQSYLLGLMRVSFGVYMVLSTLIPASYISGIIVFGDAMRSGKTGAALSAAGLVALVGAGLYFLRRKLAVKNGVVSPLPATPSDITGDTER